jgi:conjugal transfer pilus assembly protein TraF
MRKKIYSFFLIPILLLANPDFFADSKRGWFFYEIKEVESEDNNATVVVPSADVLNSMTSDQLRDTIKSAKKISIMNPTEDNVSNYIVLQNFATKKSDEFMKVWKQVVLKNPQLDLTQDSSKGKFSSKAYKDIKDRKFKEFIDANLDRIAIVTFYNQNDKEKNIVHNRVMSFLETDFSKLEYRYLNIKEFEDMAIRLKVDVTPALFMVYRNNNDEANFYRLGTGLVTKDKILSNMQFIIQREIKAKKQ